MTEHIKKEILIKLVKLNYQICAVYEKGSTGIYSFSYNDAFIVNEYWHERNFSDREEKDLPDIVQKAPASSEVVQEEKKENLNTGSAGYHYGDSYGTDNNADGQNSSSNKASVQKLLKYRIQRIL